MLPNRCPGCFLHGLDEPIEWNGQYYVSAAYVKPCRGPPSNHVSALPRMQQTYCGRGHVVSENLYPPCIPCGLPAEREVTAYVNLPSYSVSAKTRYIDVRNHSGRWIVYDLLDKDQPREAKNAVYRQSKEDCKVLRDEIKTARLAWLLCARKLGVHKDVAKMVARMVGQRPYTSVVKRRDVMDVYNYMWTVVACVFAIVTCVWRYQ